MVTKYYIVLALGHLGFEISLLSRASLIMLEIFRIIVVFFIPKSVLLFQKNSIFHKIFLIILLLFQLGISEIVLTAIATVGNYETN